MYRVNWQEIKRKQMLKFKVKKKGGGVSAEKDKDIQDVYI